MDISKKIWIYKNNDWKIASFIEYIKETDQYKILLDENEILVDNIYTCNDDKDDFKDNLIDIPHLNEPSILNAIYLRYNQNIIYTYTGNILISINPFQNLQLYTNQIINSYKKKKVNSPHVYQIANKCFYDLQLKCNNQTILISGESGSGKTYTARSIIKYLTKLSDNNSDIEQKIIQSNPILESFGNAKTLRNSNSSRFGKYIQIQIDKNNIAGSHIQTYLLEKIRVVNQVDNERNYHIFYQLLSNSNFKNKYNLSDHTAYKYLNNKYIKCHDIDDNIEFQKTLDAFQIMQFNEEHIGNIYQTIAAILHIGNLEVDDDYNIINYESIIIISKLLNIDKDIILNCLLHRYIVVNEERIEINLDKGDFHIAKNSLSMKLYDQLFKWIVNYINNDLDSNCKTFISILDIFGFESFDVNTFEQFCINYTNEKLQYQFNNYMFKLEQKEYTQEGIDWTHITFPDNEECLCLLESKNSIITMLNEECKLPKGNDINFTNRLLKQFENNNYISRNKKYANSKFIINHYAGNVEYTTTNFCKKNKDMISDEVTQVLQKTFFNTNKNTSIRKSNKSVIIQFRKQLQDLMKTISPTDPHYIRCIKPTDDDLPNKFDRFRVNQQVKYSGILSAIKVSRAGYPIRFKYNDFFDKYNVILNSGNYNSYLDSYFQNKEYCTGKTKMFLKNCVYDFLEDAKNKVLVKFIIIIQKNIRRWLSYQKYLQNIKYIILIQSYIRRKLCYNIYNRLVKEKCSIIIESCYRRYKEYIKYNYKRNKIIIIQKWYRNTKFNFVLKKVLIIQKWWKEVLHKIKSIKVLNAVILIQKTYKKYLSYKKRITYINDQLSQNIEQLEKEKEHKEKHIERLNNEKQEVEIKHRNSIKKCKELKLENDMYQQSIDNSVHQKIQLANTLEQLLIENDRMKRQMERMNQRRDENKCIIS